MTIKIYHNPRCSKSRQALDLLKSKNIETQVILYLENAPSVKEIKEILKMLKVSAREIMRKGEAEFAELGLVDLNISEEKLIEAISESPKLLERPIVVNGTKAAIGRPIENILEILCKRGWIKC